MSVNMDYFVLDALLSEESKLARTAVRHWVDKRLKPVMESCAEASRFPREFIPEMADLGLFGCTIPVDYGGGGADYITYGLMMQELERGDSGMRSAASVQGSLVMYPIFTYGSTDQKERYLKKLGSGDLIGCFGLTEPDHGSDPASMGCHFREEEDMLILNGSKMWISNAPIADIAVVWAKDPEGKVRGLILERGMEGFSTPEIKDKWSLRVSSTGELVFDDVRVPKTQLLPGVSGMKGPLSCLNQARYGIAWGALGAAMDCYQTAMEYALQRKQFGRPLAAFQLQQKKLAEMLTRLTTAQLLVWRLGTLMQAGSASPAQISMAKRNSVETALYIARESRQILGAMGISGEYPIMRHMMNLESVITYEGTHDIHLLITGMDITGLNAFS